MNVIELIRERATSSPRGVVFFLNPYTYLVLRERPDLLKKADSICFDGTILCLLFKWMGISNIHRVSFDNTSYAPILFDRAVSDNKSIALVGSEESVMAKFSEYVEKVYPGIRIVYKRNGFFDSASSISESYDSIKHHCADIVVVGMGAGKQEEYLAGLLNSGWAGEAYTCGGFMHQTAGAGHAYYPAWIDRYNLRFLYRMYDEPKLINRYFFDYPVFLCKFLWDYVR